MGRVGEKKDLTGRSQCSTPVQIPGVDLRYGRGAEEQKSGGEQGRLWVVALMNFDDQNRQYGTMVRAGLKPVPTRVTDFDRQISMDTLQPKLDCQVTSDNLA